MDRFNYISIPKTASQSVHKYFNMDVSHNHCSIYAYEDRDFYSFSFIREPVERLLSWYQWHRDNHADVSTSNIYQCSFEDWVNGGCKHHWGDNILLYAKITSPLNQFEFVCKDGVIDVDFLGDYASINNQIQSICMELGGQSCGIPMRIIGKSFRNESHVSSDVVNKIKQMFPKDFILYEQIRVNSNRLLKNHKAF